MKKKTTTQKKKPPKEKPSDGSLTLPRNYIEKVVRRHVNDCLFEGVAKVTRLEWGTACMVISFREF